MDEYNPRGNEEAFFLYQTLVWAFLNMYPGASCGRAHIVLEDHNNDNATIDRVVEDCEAWLGNGIGPDPTDPNIHSDREIGATIAFLKFIRELPTHFRREPGAIYMGEEWDDVNA